MKILVTGATGFVGNAVAQNLINKGHEVLGLIRNPNKAPHLEAQGIEPFIADITDRKKLVQAVKMVDGIFHGAAANIPDWNAINREAILTMFEVIGGSSKPFAMQSGAMVFGDTGTQPLSDAKLSFQPPSYLRERANLEQLVLKITDVRSSIIYASYVCGGDGAVIPSIMKKTAQKMGVSYYPDDGSKLWSTIHIADWANLITLVLTNPNTEGIYVASNEILSLKSIAQEIGHEIGLMDDAQSIDSKEINDLWSMFTMPLVSLNQAFAGDRAKTELSWQPEKVMKQLV